MKLLLALLCLALCSCATVKKAGTCTTATGFGVMEAGIKPIIVVDRIEGKARVPVKLVTLPICLACAATGIVIGSPLVVVGAVMEGDY